MSGASGRQTYSEETPLQTVMRVIDEMIEDDEKRKSRRLQIEVLHDILAGDDEPSPSVAFSTLISMCGLSQAEAATILGIAPQTVRTKAAGIRRPTDLEIDTLVGVWQRIVDHDVDGLPEGPRRVSEIIGWARRRQQ